MNPARWLVLVLTVGVAGPVTAQNTQDTVMLPEVVVTATGVPMDPERVTARITVISGDELRKDGVTYVADALRAVAGLSISRNGSFGAVTSAFMRGGQSDYVQVLIDGVAVNQPGGAYNYADLLVANIERVEILRGPAGVLYGSDAVSGVVHIITKDGSGPMRAEAEVRAGSYGTLDVIASARGGSDQASFAAELRRTDTDGTLPYNNQYGNTTLSGRLTLAPDDRTKAALSVRYVDSEYHFPTDGSGALADTNQFARNDATTVGLEVSRFLSPTVQGELSAKLNLGNGGGDDAPDSPGDTLGVYASRSQRKIDRKSLEGRVHFYLPLDGILSFGAAVEQQVERSVSDFQSSFGPFGSTVDVDRMNVAGYGQLLGRLADRLSVQIGARVDRNEVFGTFLTGRGGVTLDVTSTTRVSGSAGNAFKEPTFIENYGGGFAVGNPDLVPERALSWEVSGEQHLFTGQMTVSVTYFNQQFKDMIQYTGTVDPGQPNFHNVAAADANGVEIEGSVGVWRGFRLWGMYTYLDAKVTDPGFEGGPGTEFEEGQSLLRRPAYTIAGGARYDIERVGLSLRYRYIGSRADLDFSDFPSARVTLPAYHVVDVSGAVTLIGHQGGRSVGINARVENLLNERYQEIYGFVAPGRTVMLGVRVGG